MVDVGSSDPFAKELALLIFIFHSKKPTQQVFWSIISQFRHEARISKHCCWKEQFFYFPQSLLVHSHAFFSADMAVFMPKHWTSSGNWSELQLTRKNQVSKWIKVNRDPDQTPYPFHHTAEHMLMSVPKREV